MQVRVEAWGHHPEEVVVLLQCSNVARLWGELASRTCNGMIRATTKGPVEGSGHLPIVCLPIEVRHHHSKGLDRPNVL